MADARFELLREAGVGASGVVYEAVDRASGQRVALKLLAAPERDGRVGREAALLAKLQHPSIVRYVGHGQIGSQTYLAMEWLEGETLEARLRRGRLDPHSTVLLARRVVQGLSFAARHTVMHRDIKPANLFLVNGEVAHAKILDFGLARTIDDSQALTRTGVAIGTPLYMSPEQAHGERSIDTRSDVFALGSVLYECLTASAPFAGSNALATLAKICLFEPAPLDTLHPELPPELARLVHGMLAKDPAARPEYQEIEHALQALDSGAALGAERSAPPAAHASWRGHTGDGSVGLRSSRKSGERRVVCALFVGAPAEGSATLEARLAASAAQCGRLERLLDGSHVLVFERRGAPSEQALAAGRCALELHRAVPDVPIVLCTGRAVVDGNLPMGELLERSALLLMLTEPGVVRVDDTSARLLEARFELAGEGAERELVRERSGGEAPRTLLGRVTPFMGRERELTQIELTFGECVDDGIARAVLVTAPAGAGKSRLRYEVTQRLLGARAGFTLLVGRGDSMRMNAQLGVLGSALRAWAEIDAAEPGERAFEKLERRLSTHLSGERLQTVSDFLGELMGVARGDEPGPQLRAARLDPQLMADRLLSSFLAWLSSLCAAAPVLFIVEDLHWADAASVRFLSAALRAEAERPLMLLALARPEVHDSYPRLWAERDVIEIKLPRLSSKVFERLLAAVAGPELSPALRGWVVERAEGNPFLLEELVRGLHERGEGQTLPDTVLGVVQARLDALGPEAKQLMRAASVFGQSFRAEGVAALLGPEVATFDVAGWLEVLSEREVIYPRETGDGAEYAFRHALIRDAAYALMPDEERAMAHRLAAAWLERSGGTDAAVLAEHYERGDELERAAHWYGVAAARAYEASELPEVMRCAERAIACGALDAALAEVASLRAEALSWHAKDTEAMKWAQIAEEHAAADSASWWRARQVLVVSQLRLGAREAAAEATEALLSAAPIGVWTLERLGALAHVAINMYMFSEHELGGRLLSALRAARADELGERARGLRSRVETFAAFADDLGLALSHEQRALSALRRAGTRVEAALSLSTVAFLLAELGDYAEAEAHLLEELALTRQMGSDDEGATHENLGLVYGRKGELARAEESLERALCAHLRRGDVQHEAFVRAYLAQVQSSAGKLEAARESIEAAMRCAITHPTARAVVLATAAKLALQQDQPESALRQASEAKQLTREHALLEHVDTILLVHAEALIACDLRDEARAAVREAHAWLAERAAKIQAPALRRSFLENVPEHVRINALARSWLDASET